MSISIKLLCDWIFLPSVVKNVDCNLYLWAWKFIFRTHSHSHFPFFRLKRTIAYNFYISSLSLSFHFFFLRFTKPTLALRPALRTRVESSRLSSRLSAKFLVELFSHPHPLSSISIGTLPFDDSFRILHSVGIQDRLYALMKFFTILGSSQVLHA